MNRSRRWIRLEPFLDFPTPNGNDSEARRGTTRGFCRTIDDWSSISTGGHITQKPSRKERQREKRKHSFERKKHKK